MRGDIELQRKDYSKAAKSFWEAFTSARQLPYLRKYAKAAALAKDETAAEQALKEAERLARQELKDGSYGHRLELALLLIDRNTPEGLKEAITWPRKS